MPLATQLESAISYAPARTGFAKIRRRQLRLDFDRVNQTVPPVAARVPYDGAERLGCNGPVPRLEGSGRKTKPTPA